MITLADAGVRMVATRQLLTTGLARGMARG
jgi:hypothetical protein